jgi:hypothetical protein
MIEVNFPEGISEITINPLNQWDYNQKLSITGINGASSVYQVHFANRFSQEAIRRIAYRNGAAFEVNIPNKLMRDKYDITAAVFATDYERANNVTISTVGTYYTRSWVAAGSYYKYTARELPREYNDSTNYYKCVGEVVKRIVIPVNPRVEPCDCLDGDDPTDEELIAELVGYCNNLSSKVDYNSGQVSELLAKEVVELKTIEEYKALVDAGQIKAGVIYAIENDSEYKTTDLLIGDTYYKFRTTTNVQDTGQTDYITLILEE